MPCTNDHMPFLPRTAAPVYFNMADEYVYCRGKLKAPLGRPGKPLTGRVLVAQELTRARSTWRRLDDGAARRRSGGGAGRAGRAGSHVMHLFEQ